MIKYECICEIPSCQKCLLSNCTDDNCKTHTIKEKIKFKKKALKNHPEYLEEINRLEGILKKQDNMRIYSNTQDNKARFLLGEKGEKILVCIGINPSTAEPNKLDNTLHSVKRFSNNLGYDGRIIINIYPQRATNPDNLDINLNNKYHQKNIEEITNLFKKNNCDIRAARGNLIEKRQYLKQCLENIYEYIKNENINWYSIGKVSIKGHPHHPLYLNKNLKLDRFDIEKYINNLKL